MCEPADRNTASSGDTSHRVGEALRSPIRYVERVARDGIYNIRRDAGLARNARVGQQVRLDLAASRARQAQMRDNVDELDDRLLDVIVCAQLALLARDFGPPLLIWASVEGIRAVGAEEEPKIGPELQRLALPGGDTTENLIRVIAGAERSLEMLRTSFPHLTVRHTT